MTATETEEKLYTIEEYLEREVRSEYKNEYFDGKIVRRKGVQIMQCMMAVNLLTAVHTALQTLDNTTFKVLGSGLLNYIPQFNYLLYPGAGVVFEEPLFLTKEQNVLLNPVVIFEISSASDTAYNHSSRFHYYKTVPSFKEYIFIEQDTPFVSSFYKSADHAWNDSEATQLDSSIFLHSINCSIDLARIYNNVPFAKPF